jgi:hypothetical protein
MSKAVRPAPQAVRPARAGNLDEVISTTARSNALVCSNRKGVNTLVSLEPGLDPPILPGASLYLGQSHDAVGVHGVAGVPRSTCGMAHDVKIVASTASGWGIAPSLHFPFLNLSLYISS